MIRKANKKTIGAFVIGAVTLFVIAILVFGSGTLFSQSDKYVLFFDGSVKGLSEGAPVIFKGVRIGSVKDISIVYDPEIEDVLIMVIIDVELSRVKGAPEKLGYTDYKMLVDYGLRGSLEVQNFITNQLMISFDFYPGKPANMHNITRDYPELPTLPTSPDIFKLMDELPIKEIADSLKQTVDGLNRLINLEGLYTLGNAIQEVTQAARSVRLLADYLEQHPEAFLKGKTVPKGE